MLNQNVVHLVDPNAGEERDCGRFTFSERKEETNVGYRA